MHTLDGGHTLVRAFLELSVLYVGSVLLRVVQRMKCTWEAC